MAEEQSNYFFHKSLKDILRDSGKALFSVSRKDSIDENDNSALPSEPGPSSKASNENIGSRPLEEDHKSKSWKEFFFFKRNDSRLQDGVMFFKSNNNQNNLQFNEVRKKLKQSIRHKMLKRRSLAVKRKFNKKNFKQIMYRKK